MLICGLIQSVEKVLNAISKNVYSIQRLMDCVRHILHLLRR